MNDTGIATLLDRYTATPAELRRAIAAIDPSALDRSAVPGEWTPRQIVLHLADSETVAAVRFRKLLAEDEPTFPLYAEAEWARRMDYAAADAEALAQALDIFETLRATTARLLRRAPDSAWEAAGFHPERGRMTLRDVLALYADHGEVHLAQLQRVVG